jgi:hypothetical protein
VGENRLHPDTNSLVWGAFCGFHIGSRISTRNIDEVIWRIRFLKKINRSWMSDGSFPSDEAVQNHVFLCTNCDTKTRKQWLNFVTTSLGNEVTREIERELNEIDDGVPEDEVA